ncbi:beta-lactamase [[Emmonsia] crescens]|uniref:Beta-lactamase n=1 Tax=[Emmonsia] crescens TaxID=73230 RepID=A0A0G2I1M2_9EURO|nr:beta-lactamase [Emmonsia crescens UAMH 3008]
MSEIDKIFEEYAKSTTTPFPAVTFKAVDKAGKVLYSSSHGNTKVDGSGEAVSEDTPFWAASMSKVFTAVTVMVAVERGLISLDDDVGKVVPELAEPQILDGFEEDEKPIVRKAAKKLTLRTLLTHSSGFAYHLTRDKLQKWNAYHGRDTTKMDGSYEQYRQPLLFEPGENWAYGPGVDWAGRVVEVVSKQSLEEFMKENIHDKLGLTSTTFRPEHLPNFAEHRVEISARNAEGKFNPMPVPMYPIPAADCLGGTGLYSTTREYTTLLATLLAGGGNVLKPESVEQIFKPQLEDRKSMNDLFNAPGGQRLNRILTTGKVVTMGLTVCINLDDVPGKRPAGCVGGGGLTNMFWWLDRKAGICGALFFHYIPPADPLAIEVADKIEEAVYKKLRGVA